MPTQQTVMYFAAVYFSLAFGLPIALIAIAKIGRKMRNRSR